LPRRQLGKADIYTQSTPPFFIRPSTTFGYIPWSVAVILALFKSREVFSSEYRNSIKTDPAIGLRFYSSPYFVAGMIVWVIVGCALVAL
jgi:hypothetical protein